MKLFDYFDRYLVDNEFKVIITRNYINIINYLEVVDFSDKEIFIKYSDGAMVIKGSNLVLSKMQDEELLVKGDIKSILYK